MRGSVRQLMKWSRGKPLLIRLVKSKALFHIRPCGDDNYCMSPLNECASCVLIDQYTSGMFEVVL